MGTNPLSLWELMRSIELHVFIGRIRAFMNQVGLGHVFDDDPERQGYVLQGLQGELKALEAAIKLADLPMSLKWVERVADMIHRQRNGASIDFRGLERSINTLATSIEDELSTRAYFEMEPAEVESWRRKLAFGERVSDKFPSTDFELQEYSKCYAVGRYTASVFHLMRVLEIGLSALARSIGADPENKSWEQILNSINSRLKVISEQKPQGWKDQEQFYSEVASHFRNLKNAWRNYTMHVHVKYDKDDAEEIFFAVKSVMRTLSTQIGEELYGDRTAEQV